jgi:hypothetical protein
MQPIMIDARLALVEADWPVKRREDVREEESSIVHASGNETQFEVMFGFV